MKHNKSLLFLRVGALALIGALSPTVSGQTLNYRLDDGTAEQATGGGANQTTAFFNQFQVQGGFSTITSIEVQWASFSGSDRMVTAAVWSDPNQNGEPTDALAIAESLPTFSDKSSAWQTFDLTSEVDVGSAGDYFFVGFYQTNGVDFGESLLVNLDNSGSNRSFGTRIGPPDDPDDLSNYSQFTNLMIRANAVPEPTTLSIAMFGAMLFLRRRK